jgi:hypothetical protein
MISSTLIRLDANGNESLLLFFGTSLVNPTPFHCVLKFVCFVVGFINFVNTN